MKLSCGFLTFQVMSCQPRSDLFINLPALQKLDNMLLVRDIYLSVSLIYLFIKNLAAMDIYLIYCILLCLGNT